jgi:hypothetical protein
MRKCANPVPSVWETSEGESAKGDGFRRPKPFAPGGRFVEVVPSSLSGTKTEPLHAKNTRKKEEEVKYK